MERTVYSELSMEFHRSLHRWEPFINYSYILIEDPRIRQRKLREVFHWTRTRAWIAFDGPILGIRRSCSLSGVDFRSRLPTAATAERVNFFPGSRARRKQQRNKKGIEQGKMEYCGVGVPGRHPGIGLVTLGQCGIAVLGGLRDSSLSLPENGLLGLKGE
ncbi:uncharacterized protein BDZ99DRAFT_527206 [Mytilinidion resinicola]|uniref:Uncharacterized protein n=1 Tax=Mytilinidion resinicola TaxID=574789 RepID=A0A6A6Y1T6_9PEZI|nr:uncharacterized protein BDZ99DRAFT_527206 [Mytilinidion resinicola]KAF2802776.1 hypothetical protein BDZ99DRAFT_527206 [Mytilinidion resinicola]